MNITSNVSKSYGYSLPPVLTNRSSGGGLIWLSGLKGITFGKQVSILAQGTDGVASKEGLERPKLRGNPLLNGGLVISVVPPPGKLTWNPKMGGLEDVSVVFFNGMFLQVLCLFFGLQNICKTLDFFQLNV